MKFGVDFGTTRIIVAAVDRGNYPLVSFETPEGVYDWFPSLIALTGSGRDMEMKFGWDAWQVQADPSWTVIRSVKRFLEGAGSQTAISADGREVPLIELLAGLTRALRLKLIENYGEQPAEVMLGVPANANNNQRFLTIEAFRQAGFSVLGLLNEPSAAAVEFGHRHKSKGRILVYDLGGGTFDVSLVDIEGGQHTVLASDGISTLGGDDFDFALAELALGADKDRNALYGLQLGEFFRLIEECRRQKEALHPNSRRIVVDMDVIREGMGQAAVSVSDFYERCRPLLAESVRATARLAEGQSIEALYVTGGGSELPLVARVLREEFGRKVKRSEYTRSATAIGLAIQADAASGYKLREMFNRNFGVWRESDGGQRVVFDAIFPYGTQLPAAGAAPLEVARRYRPVHNVGYFRFLEASYMGENGQPEGDLTLWDEILFPFDPELAGRGSLEGIAIAHTPAAASQEIEEHYTCDAAGCVSVTIRNLTVGYEREYKLGRWSDQGIAVQAGPKKRVRNAGIAEQ